MVEAATCATASACWKVAVNGWLMAEKGTSWLSASRIYGRVFNPPPFEQHMSGWAACLLKGEAGELVGLRLFPDIQFAEVGGVCWLRGSKLDNDLEQELKKIPGLVRFDLLSGDKLRPAGSRIPDRTLPP